MERKNRENFGEEEQKTERERVKQYLTFKRVADDDQICFRHEMNFLDSNHMYI